MSDKTPPRREDRGTTRTPVVVTDYQVLSLKSVDLFNDESRKAIASGLQPYGKLYVCIVNEQGQAPKPLYTQVWARFSGSVQQAAPNDT